MDYEEFLRAVAPELGLDWRKYRRRTSRRAVTARVAELGLSSLGEYRERVLGDPEEARGLPDRMRVTVSRFLREQSRWDALFDRVIPELTAGRSRFRVWSAGCCGGEEPFTFSLLWRDRIAPSRPGLELSVLATDIDRPSLERAARGVYGAGSLREVPTALRASWFSAQGGRWLVSPAARGAVCFREHNLLEDAPPRGMDLVLCRYFVFTYFRGVRRAEAVRRLHGGLLPGGALVIGRKEGLTPDDGRFFEGWPGAEGVLARRSWVRTTPGSGNLPPEVPDGPGRLPPG
ncbi:MAG: CheR family methyltransferase [Deferrisomatales bacterium]